MLWNLTADEWITSFGFICCVAYIGGWLTDRILGYGGFSVIGNWLILLLGAYIGMFGYNYLGYRLQWDSIITMVVCVGSALVFLLVMLSIKTIFSIR